VGELRDRFLGRTWLALYILPWWLAAHAPYHYSHDNQCVSVVPKRKTTTTDQRTRRIARTTGPPDAVLGENVASAPVELAWSNGQQAAVGSPANQFHRRDRGRKREQKRESISMRCRAYQVIDNQRMPQSPRQPSVCRPIALRLNRVAGSKANRNLAEDPGRAADAKPIGNRFRRRQETPPRAQNLKRKYGLIRSIS
jgi:hypothetical protein